MPRPIIYIAGPYRGADESETFANVMKARDAATVVWREGGAAICPHMNSMMMGGCAEFEDFLELDLRLIEIADAVLMFGKHEQSDGACIEHAHAVTRGKPILHNRVALRDFIAAHKESQLQRKEGDGIDTQ